ncbi:retrovirus-related pol polyprotein from transposon TNT 1-94 [Tanacetum coccineum]
MTHWYVALRIQLRIVLWILVQRSMLSICKEELKRFKLRSDKVRFADDKTLDIAGVGDVVLKTSFGTSWTLKDVMYIPNLKRRLILVGQLDEEGYHVGFRDQQWKVSKGSLVVAHGNKYGSLYMVEFGKAEESFLHNVREDKETAKRSYGKYNANLQEKCLKFDNGEEYKQKARGFVQRLRRCWADSVSTTYLIYRIPYVLIGMRILEEEWQGKDTSLAHLKVFGCDSIVKGKDVCGEAMKFTSYTAPQMKCDTAFGIRRVTRLSRAKMLHLWTRFMKPENDSVVVEHGLSSEFTYNPGGSLDTNEGSENSGSFKDSRRSDEEYSGDKASSKEGKAINEEMVSLEKNQTCSLVRLPTGKKASQSLWMFRVRAEQDGRKRVLIFVEDSWNEEPCSDVHQTGDEIEVEVLHSFNWPPSKLITEDGILPERGYSQLMMLVQDTLYRMSPGPRVLYVQRYRKVRAVALLMGRWLEVYRDYLRWRAVKSSASKWEIVEL